MPSIEPRLIIIDQSLKGFAGHHYDLSRAVIQAAQNMGLRPLLACHRDFPETTLEGAPIIDRFREDWREGSRSPWRSLARKTLSQLPESVRHRLLASLHSNSTATRSKPDPRFALTLLKFLDSVPATQQDHVLVHTLGEAEFLGIADVLERAAAFVPHLHIVLRYDGTDACRSAFVKLARANAQISLWTDTELLAAHYRNLGCANIGVLPIPHCLDTVPEWRRTKGTPLTLAYLGGARSDKGFLSLPSLVAALADNYLATGRIRFLIQATYDLSREEALIAKAKREFARFPREWVKLIERPPSSTQFREALFASDLLLLPYDREIYRRRSSGLLIQAMVTGIPTVVPEDTWLSAEAPKSAHVAFGDNCTLADAVQSAISNYDALRRGAQFAATQAKAQHAAVSLVRLITTPQPKTATPHG